MSKPTRPDIRRPTARQPSTLPPPFDPAQYAKESDAQIRAVPRLPDLDGIASDAGPDSEVRIALHSPNADDEAWARACEGAPALAVPLAELRKIDLGPRAAFLLSMLDGVADLETVIDASGVPRDEALATIRSLTGRGVITFR